MASYWSHDWLIFLSKWKGKEARMINYIFPVCFCFFCFVLFCFCFSFFLYLLFLRCSFIKSKITDTNRLEVFTLVEVIFLYMLILIVYFWASTLCLVLYINQYRKKKKKVLTSNHFLTDKLTKYFSSNEFLQKGINSRKCWKSVPALTNMFWTRFIKEYLPIL